MVSGVHLADAEYSERFPEETEIGRYVGSWHEDRRSAVGKGGILSRDDAAVEREVG